MPIHAAARYRGRDATSWILTSVALSFLVHMLLMRYLGGLRLLDVEQFRSSVSRLFNVVEIPKPSLPPEYEPLASQIPTQADRAAEADPAAIPIASPDRASTRPRAGAQPDIRLTAHRPAPAGLPAAALPGIGRKAEIAIERVLERAASVAPVAVPAAPAAPSAEPDAPGHVRVASGTPKLPAAPPTGLPLPELPSARPVIAVPAAPLAPPPIKPVATPVHRPAEAPPVGIVIPLEDTVARRETPIPKVVIRPPRVVEEGAKPPRVFPFGDEVGVSFQMHAEPGNPRCYFRFEIAVAKPEKLPVIPKDVLFVCDVSLSIRRGEMDTVRAAIVGYLRRLRPTDRFNVVVFSEEAVKLFSGFVAPTPERIESARRFVRRLRGQIRTDVYHVLRAVVSDLAAHTHRNRPCHLYFLSDGESTAGIRDVRRIVEEIGGAARPNFAIFPFDAGKSGNRYLLDLLAYRSRGVFAFADRLADAPKALGGLFASFDSPVLMSLEPEYTNLDAAEVYPESIPNLYAGRPVVLYGRCTLGRNVSIRLQGKNPSTRRTLFYQATPGRPDPGRADIAREWARRKIHHLVAQMVRGGDTATLKAEIERLGTKYKIPTPYKP